MKIGIDARFLTHPQKGGFKTYTENLITALAEIDTENEYVLFLDRSPSSQTKLPTQANFTSRVVSGSYAVVGMPWREQVGLARQAAQDHLHLFHAPCLTAPLRLVVPSIITIHDTIWLFPHRFRQSSTNSLQRRMMDWYNYYVPKIAARRASHILTVSQAAKDSIMQYLRIPDERICVTHEAPSHIYQPVKDNEKKASFLRSHKLPPSFILAIGSADPRKNIATLVQAYALLPASLREQFRLVIVWTHHFLADEMAKQVEKMGLTDQVQFLKHVSNEDLVMLYNTAALFVFPSRYEGFGLPPLEAMACGTPVVASDNSSIPEIAGDAALYFQSEDATQMAYTISKVLTDPNLIQDLVEKGYRRVAIFSWQKCARETIQVYHAAVAETRPLFGK